MDKPLISIIIPAYNGSKYLREAIDSSLAQTYSNFEVIVINDGSTDDTEKIIKSYGKKIHYFNQNNQGVSSALNLGISKANGSYISWLSHDDVYTPNKLKMQIEALSELKETDRENTIVFSNYKIIDEKSEVTEVCPIHQVHDIKKFSCHLYPVVKGLIFGCSLLIPKKCFEELGLFNTNLRTSQDYDMWMRLFPQYNIKFIPNYLLFSRRHSGQGSYSAQAMCESNHFWITLMQKISDHDKIVIDRSLGSFYFLMYRQMKNVGYLVASEYAKKRYDNLNLSIVTRIYYLARYLCQPFLLKVQRIFGILRKILGLS